MHNPFFSIVIPTFNRANMIIETLESIRNQTYTDFEVIIVDDGSIDNTNEIVSNFIIHNCLEKNWTYYKKENGERAVARNYGTQKAKGQYICWFDSDDIMRTNHLENVSQKIVELNDCRFFSSGYTIENQFHRVLFQSTYSGRMNDLMYLGNHFACSPVFVERKLALQNPFNEDRFLSGSEDYELWLRLTPKTSIFADYDATVIINQHENRSVLTMNDEYQLITRFEKFLNYTLSNHELMTYMGRNKKRFVMKNYLILSVELAQARYKRKSILYLKKAMKSSSLFLIDKSFYAILKYLIWK